MKGSVSGKSVIFLQGKTGACYASEHTTHTTKLSREKMCTSGMEEGRREGSTLSSSSSTVLPDDESSSYKCVAPLLVIDVSIRQSHDYMGNGVEGVWEMEWRW